MHETAHAALLADIVDVLYGSSLAAKDRSSSPPALGRYAIRIHGHLGATVLSAFPALVPQHQCADTVLTGQR